jgi:hypothetical protein
MTPRIETTACVSCGGGIIWAINGTTGKRMPVDAEPVENGNVVLAIMGQGRTVCGKWRHRGTVVATVLKKGQSVEAGRPRRVSHFATCPNAASHRR